MFEMLADANWYPGGNLEGDLWSWEKRSILVTLAWEQVTDILRRWSREGQLGNCFQSMMELRYNGVVGMEEVAKWGSRVDANVE
jgi:hypothetical protein